MTLWNIAECHVLPHGFSIQQYGRGGVVGG